LLRARLFLGILIVAALVGLCWLDACADWPGTFLLPLAIIVSMLAAGELLAMWRKKAGFPQPMPWVVYAGTVATVLLSGAPTWLPSSWSGGATIGNVGWLAIGLVASLLTAMIDVMRRYNGPGNATARLALTCLAIVYVGGLMGFVVQLRLLGIGAADNSARLGMVALVSMIAIVKLSDIGQYTAGRLFGVHKLAPTISPGKTWEGVLGGMVFAILGGLMTFWIARAMHMKIPSRILPDHPLASVVFMLYPLAIAASGIVGDLAESMLKRDAGVKDSSAWLPGFGGVLDLLDSLLGAAPIAFFFWVVVLGA
jgi:phosphatidate cytidylyltransferase